MSRIEAFFKEIRKLKFLFVRKLSFPLPVHPKNFVDVIFYVGTDKFEYSANKRSISLHGGNHSTKDMLWVRLTKGKNNSGYSPKFWNIILQTDSSSCRYECSFLEELPPEVFSIITQLSVACWKEVNEIPKREAQEEEERKQLMLSQISGPNAMLSPNVLIRTAAQKHNTKAK